MLAELGDSADKGLPAAEVERLLEAAGEPSLTRHHWGMIVGYGAVIALATLGAFFVAQLFHVLNMRNRGTHHLREAPLQRIPTS